MAVLFHSRHMLTILPECPFFVFANIVFLAGSASYQLY